MSILKVKRVGQHYLPTPYQENRGDAGYDLRTVNDIVIHPYEQVLIDTGFKWMIPENYVGLIRDRSSIAKNYGCYVFAGVVDSSYRGEVKILMRNITDNLYKFTTGDKMAQMLVVPCAHFKLDEVKIIDDTDRGTGGFGSTGQN